MKHKMVKPGMLAVVVVGLLPLAQSAIAIDVSVSGLIRQEMAYKISSKENPTLRGGSPFNGVPVPLDGPLAPPGFISLEEDKSTDNDWNVFATRAEVEFNVGISNQLTAFAKIRGYYQPDVFNEARVNYQGRDGQGPNSDSNYFRVDNHGNTANYLEVSDDNYMIDMPALYLDYTSGPLWLRIGQQQIAWGESLFFRVADVPNGLDLRRHLFFDFGAEEFADERQAAPGIRGSYNFNEHWELEMFAQMFQPSVLPARNSPFNLILAGFSIDNQTGYDKVDDQINGGIRLKGSFDNLGFQLFAVSRHNPDPIFRLVPGGQTDSPFGTAVFGPSGQTFADQPFVYHGFRSGTRGDAVSSPDGWFYHTGIGGLDGLATINGLARTYPVIKEIFENLFLLSPDANGDYFTAVTAPGSGPNGLSGYDILDAFFVPGSIDGGLLPTYAAEDVFGGGINYIFYAEPDTLLDQLVVRFEASFTPDKKFTALDLSPDYIVEDEWVTSLVLEKYHRFSEAFPATFFIFEWMHKSESDLLGRHLSGLGGDKTHTPRGGEDDRGWDGLVFAFQQPFPSLVWRADLSVLYDLNGGFFIQPAVRYKPSGSWTVEAFVNFIDSNDNASIFSTTDWSDDFNLRLTYQF